MGPGKKSFNPSGEWVVMDTELFEVICLPFRAPGDESNADPYGNGGGESRHGYCANAGRGTRNGEFAQAVGDCPNHQLEYIEYYEETMKEILADFGVTTRRYQFEVAGGGNTLGGRAINPAAIVPGADHPEEHIVIGAHYDQTNDGQASAWDSQEGHAQMIRVAKIMADYWRATGTRPSATVKFIPWDAEESGTLGSADYVNNTIVPGQEDKVRGYWNTDPCAGGYPAFRFGNPSDRVDLGIQVGNPAQSGGDPARMTAFNQRAPQLVEQVFEHLDDNIPNGPAGTPARREIFVAQSEATATMRADTDPTTGDVRVGLQQPVLFSSDWRNFLAAGVPFFNPGPEITGPNSGGGSTDPGNPDALAILHTPNDNLETMMRYTGNQMSAVSEAWAKGFEMCSHLLGWGMLQHDQGGAQKTSNDVVAYFEALPNEAEVNGQVTFDAGGSHQYINGRRVSEADLDYQWDFGDGAVRFGSSCGHAYRQARTFPAKLTVTNIRTGQSDSMTIPITVEPSSLGPPAPDVCGTTPKPRLPGGDGAGGGGLGSCARGAGFRSAGVTPSGPGLKFASQPASGQSVTGEVFQISKGRKALRRPKRVARFNVKAGSVVRKGKFTNGIYEARLKAGADVRRFAFERRGKKFRKRKAVAMTDSCGALSSFSLSAPAFGGRTALKIGYRLGERASVAVAVYRGRKAVKRFKAATGDAGRTVSLKLAPKRLRRGEYRVVLTLERGGKKTNHTLYTRKV